MAFKRDGKKEEVAVIQADDQALVYDEVKWPSLNDTCRC